MAVVERLFDTNGRNQAPSRRLYVNAIKDVLHKMMELSSRETLEVDKKVKVEADWSCFTLPRSRAVVE